ncbi:anthocyanidin-3-O-glucoside rhamnosyltransferase-like [Euphorbia lathyris]|uniref:anthocyanidin-3-O-glucoside rhamnosyltransferase-like n=1 Tax=Euphorbia lathyris TaxID=212925 RepID=UPI0033130AA1
MAAIAPESEVHIVMFPWLAFGHISPFVQLANKLSSHGLKISFLSAPGNITRIQSSLLLTPFAQIIPISIPPVDGLPPNLDSTAQMTPPMAELLKKALDLMQPQMNSLLIQLKPHFVIFDPLLHWVPKIASELGIKTIAFSVFSAISGAYLMVPSRSQIAKSGDLLKPPPGFPSTSVTSINRYEAQDLVYVYKKFNDGPSVYQRTVEAMSSSNALIVKTCNEMEGAYLDFIGNQFGKNILLTGPLVPNPVPDSGVNILDEKWRKWLSQFSSKTVTFCSFGSETFLKDEQIKELALGLEATSLPFILVLNFPAGIEAEEELKRTLPEGFIERVKDRGMVHTGWVQQKSILGHENVGCFLCHAGFSSLIEGIMNDCQIVLLPLKGDQFLNSRLMGGDLKVGVEVNRRDEDGYFGKHDVEEAVRKVTMDVEKEPGKSVRMNHEKWRAFLLNSDIQDKFITDLVEDLKTRID